MLTPLLRDAWRQEELTVNYRTPEAVATAARELAIAAGLPVSPLTSAREYPGALNIHSSSGSQLVHDSVTLAVRTLAEVVQDGAGQVAIVAGPAQHAGLLRVLAGLEDAARTDDPSPSLDALSVLTPSQAKGLEFDAVVLVEPQEILAGQGGASDLYVAMTRPTKFLHITHAQPLPLGLSETTSAAAAPSE
jgi:hypothetical protein